MRLPDAFEVELAADTILDRRGHVLIGGAPLTALSMSTGAATRMSGTRLVVDDAATAALAERLLASNVAHPLLSSLAPIRPDNLTVVVPIRDRAQQLGRCLTALGDTLHCVVVDDQSQDPDRIEAVALAHGATYVHLPANVGPAGARNAGLAEVETPFVAFVDSDVQVSAAALTQLARHFADPRVTLIGPRIIGTAGVTQRRWFHAYDEHFSSLSLGARPASVAPRSSVAWLPSACLVARTRDLGDGFASELRVGEDVDLVWRLVASGRRARYEPCVVAMHDSRPTLLSWMARKAFYGSGSAALADRHGDKVAPAVLSPSLGLAALCILSRRRVSLPLSAAVVAYAYRTIATRLPDFDERRQVAARVAVRGLGWAVRQEASLVLRHWLPLMAPFILVSRTARRLTLTSLAVDAAVYILEARRRNTSPTVAGFGARRLDDAAYGVGLIWGAIQQLSAKALLPASPATASGRRATPAPRRTRRTKYSRRSRHVASWLQWAQAKTDRCPARREPR